MSDQKAPAMQVRKRKDAPDLDAATESKAAKQPPAAMQSQSTLGDLSAHIFADSVRDRWGNTVLPANQNAASHTSPTCHCALSRLRHSSNCLLAATSIWADSKEYERMQIDAAPFLHPVVESSGLHMSGNVPLQIISEALLDRLPGQVAFVHAILQDIQNRQSRASLEQRYLRIDAELDTAFHQFFRCVSLLHLAPTEVPTSLTQPAALNQSKPVSASGSTGSGSVTVDSYTRWTPSWAATITPAQPATHAFLSTSSIESAVNTSSSICSCKRPISITVPMPPPLHSADLEYDAKLFGERDWNFLISAPTAAAAPSTAPPDTSSSTSKTTSASATKSAAHSNSKQLQPAAQTAVPASAVGTSNVTVATNQISASTTPDLPTELKSWLHVRGRLLYCIQSASQLFSLRSPCATRLALRLLLRLLTDGPLMLDARRSAQHTQLRLYFTNRNACYDHWLEPIRATLWHALLGALQSSSLIVSDVVRLEVADILVEADPIGRYTSTLLHKQSWAPALRVARVSAFLVRPTPESLTRAAEQLHALSSDQSARSMLDSCVFLSRRVLCTTGDASPSVPLYRICNVLKTNTKAHTELATFVNMQHVCASFLLPISSSDRLEQESSSQHFNFLMNHGFYASAFHITDSSRIAMEINRIQAAFFSVPETSASFAHLFEFDSLCGPKALAHVEQRCCQLAAQSLRCLIAASAALWRRAAIESWNVTASRGKKTTNAAPAEAVPSHADEPVSSVPLPACHPQYGPIEWIEVPSEDDSSFEDSEVGEQDMQLCMFELVEDHRYLAYLASSVSSMVTAATPSAWSCRPTELSIDIKDLAAAGHTSRGRRWTRRMLRAWELLVTCVRVASLLASVNFKPSAELSTAINTAQGSKKVALLARQKAEQLAVATKVADLVDVQLGGALLDASVGFESFDEVLGDTDASNLVVVKRAENDYDPTTPPELPVSAGVLVLLSDLRRRARVSSTLPRYLQVHQLRARMQQQEPPFEPRPTERWLLDLLPSMEPTELRSAVHQI